ncbi:MAG: dTMP kinase [Candidatus Pacebacteria bacterium]|nr:dTMP kinase [Candidatus Paceibacterota bacterium]
MKQKGKYIILEGLEGTGKGTQVEKLRERLEKLGKRVIVVREPGGTPIGEEIRKILKSPYIIRTPETEIFMFSAARAELARQIVLPALEKGVNVISDRSFLSTFTYQIYGHQRMDLMLMFEKLTAEAVGTIRPDQIIILDIAPKKGLERAQKRNAGEKDRFDDLGVPFHERVRAGYIEAARKSDFPLISTDKSIEEVSEEIWQKVKKFF